MIDATGSMSTKFNAVRSGLTEAASELSSAQSFNTVFSQMAGFATLSVSLLPATEENRIKLRTLLSRVRVEGATDPLPAIEAAFAMHPDVIFFVADGDFPDNDLVQRRFHELEQGYRIRINTIALMTHGGDVEFAGVLKRVATQSGGAFREVTAESESGH
ncbi:MAG TPA: hypothetical protein VK797_04060 [Tepidisphaeraceae bacterium]|nr:hypothetical protein [Tepidisphaeraceae bacterium]